MRLKFGDDLRVKHQQIRVKQAVYRLINNLHRRIGRDNNELIPCRLQAVIIPDNHRTAVSDMTTSRKKEFNLVQALHFAGSHFIRSKLFMSKMERLHPVILICCRLLLTEPLPECDY